MAVPLGTAAHYGFLKQMSHFGVDVGSMEVVDLDPPDGAAAIAQGAVDMFCGWGGSLRRAKEHGNVLLTGAEKTDLGILFLMSPRALRLGSQKTASWSLNSSR